MKTATNDDGVLQYDRRTKSEQNAVPPCWCRYRLHYDEAGGNDRRHPIVVRNSDNPAKRWNIPFDAPLFHWYKDEDRNRQLCLYMKETFRISADETMAAIEAGDTAQKQFHKELTEAGKKVCEDVKSKGTYAVILASRPYQNDALVNHDLPDMFTKLGIPVLTADSLPEINHVELKKSRLDVVNNYHARMLSSAVLAAKTDYLEYVQLVSFGCGHDAYLSDEIIRLMKEISGKIPLILKLDESDIQGPLRIRIRSFTETVDMRRRKESRPKIHSLSDPSCQIHKAIPQRKDCFDPKYFPCLQQTDGSGLCRTGNTHRTVGCGT